MACTIGEESELDPLDDDIQRELEQVPDVQLWAERNGLPLFVTGRFGTANGGAGLVARFYRLTDSELALDDELRDDETGRTALRFRQVRNGLDVVGSALKLEVDAAGLVDTSAGDVRGGGDLDATPAIDAAGALAAAIADPAQRASDPVLVYRATDDGPRLAWQVTVATSELDTEHVFVGALDGMVIDRLAQNSDALARRVHVAREAYPSLVPGTLGRAEGGAAVPDDKVNTNYDFLGKVHSCFRQAFGRDSYDNRGSALVSTVRYRYNAAGTQWNASWLGAPLNQMIYAADTADHRSPVFDIDVTAHEIGHGITRAESKLEYLNESGALNEGMSDVYGAVCDAAVGDGVNVFRMGEDVWTKNKANDAMRYMYNPTQDGSSRDFYPERYVGTADKGGVHWNSGIVNLAFYLTSQGGKHPRGKSIVTVNGIGLVKAARIFHRANTTYLTPQSNFRSMRAATIRAATLMYGAGEAIAVARAWAAVGVP